MITPPAHLKDKWNVYAIWMEQEYSSRPLNDLILVHIERPVSFMTLCETYIFQHPELTIDKTGEKIKTSRIHGIQKVANGNIPKYTLSQNGYLFEITR